MRSGSGGGPLSRVNTRSARAAAASARAGLSWSSLTLEPSFSPPKLYRNARSAIQLLLLSASPGLIVADCVAETGSNEAISGFTQASRAATVISEFSVLVSEFIEQAPHIVTLNACW